MKIIKNPKFTAILLSFLFLLSISKGIERPLLWNDEATTAVFARQLLRHGYPKAHDNKNNLNPTIPEDKSLCIKEPSDAYLCTGWGHYFVAAPGVYLSQFVEDIYAKTFLVRLPFALIGFLGIFLFGWLTTIFIGNRKHKYYMFSLFIFLELFSVYYALHAAQVRYYSSVVLITALVLYLYYQYLFNQKHKYQYFFLVPLLLVFLFITYHPAFFVLLGSIFFFQLLLYLTKQVNLQNFLKIMSPVFLGFIISIPLMIYFEVFYISKQYGQFLLRTIFNSDYYPLWLYFKNVRMIISFLFEHEFLAAYLVFKTTLFVVFWSNKNYKKLIKNNLFLASVHLNIYALLYLLFIARIPFLFSRYFLILQPIITVSVIIDLYLLVSFYKFKKDYLQAFLLLLGLSLAISLPFKAASFYNYAYELTHTYQGPVDSAIEEIIARYEEPSQLTIATNYAELSFVFYLDSKVIIGGVGNNLEEDMKLTPDVIVPRDGWWNRDKIDELLRKAEYEKVVLPIADISFNNIAEPAQHHFKTQYADEVGEEPLEIYFKK